MNYILHYDIAGLVIIVLTIVCLALRKKKNKACSYRIVTSSNLFCII
ncbi:MAG: hypothetical protein IJV29_01025 [Butyrivibrio sp.]|nr:hypothetical protein [Butyrivibrio sp.]